MMMMMMMMMMIMMIIIIIIVIVKIFIAQIQHYVPHKLIKSNKIKITR